MRCKFELKKSHTIKMLESKYNKDLYEILYELCFVRQMSYRAIAKELEITFKTVQKFINFYEIQQKPIKLQEGGNENV